MAGNTPLTQTPYATLDDAPNIEAAGKNGFKYIERFTIPRFASISDRNVAFLSSEASPPQVDQLCSVNGMLYVWDGSTWVDFRYYYHVLTTTKVRKAHDTPRQNSTAFTNDDELNLTIPRANTTYMLDMFLMGEGDITADLKYRLSFPAGCEFSGGPISGALDLTDAQSVPNMYLSGTIAMTDPTSVFWVMPITPVLPLLVNYSTTRFMGILDVGATTGQLRVQWGQNASHATATNLVRGSWLRIEEF